METTKGTGSKKPASKKGAAKGSATKTAGNGGGGGEKEGFDAGDVNTNIRTEAVAPARHKGQTGELFADRKIPDLHRAALDYVAVRDERMALTEREATSKDKVIQLMKKHKRETYECEGVRIIFEHVEEDKLKVKVKQDGDGSD